MVELFLPLSLIGVPLIAAAIVFTIGRRLQLCREGAALGGALLTLYLAAIAASQVLRDGPLAH